MNRTRRSGQFAESRNPTKLQKRLRILAAAAGAAAGVSALLTAGPAARANTADNVNNGQSDLTLPGTYSGGLPGTSSDVVFLGATTYSPTAFTLNGNLSIGTLNDLDTSQTLTIQNTAGNTTVLTLSTAANSVSGTAADLFYVASGGNLSIGGGGGGTLNLALGVAGNFDIAGTATINSAISGTVGLTKTGAGTLTLNGASTYTGTTVISTGTIILGVSQNGSTSGAFGTGVGALTLGSGTTLNLNGQNDTIGTLTATGTAAETITSSSGGALTVTYTNTANQYSGLILGGNASLMVTGSTGSNDPFGTTSLFTTSGTGFIGFENQSGQIRDSSIGANLGTTGSLEFNGSANFQSTSEQTIASGCSIIVYGTNNGWNVQQNGSTALQDNGPWTGNGSLALSQGFSAGFVFAGNMTGFTGTMIATAGGTGSSSNSSTYSLNDATAGAIGMPNAVLDVTLANADNSGTVTVRSTAGTSSVVAIGDLNTASPNVSGLTGNNYGAPYTGAVVLTNGETNTPLTYQIGSLGLTSTFGGNITNGSGTSTTAIQKVGTGTWSLSGGNTYTGGTTISAGTLRIGGPLAVTLNGNATVTVAYNAGLFATENILAAGIPANDTISALPTGNVSTNFTITTAATASGATTAEVLLGSTPLGSVSNALTVGQAGSTSATLDLNSFNVTVGSLSGSSAGIITSSTNLGIPVLTVSGSSSTTYAGVIQNGNSTTNGVGLELVGAETLDMTGNSTYTGATTILSVGTLQVGGGSGNIGGAAGTALTLGDSSGTNATLILGDANGVGTATVSSLTAGSGSGTYSIVGGNASNSTLTINCQRAPKPSHL